MPAKASKNRRSGQRGQPRPMRKLKITPLLLVLTLAGTACDQAANPGDAGAPTPADTVLLNGSIYTVDDLAPWAEAVAIRAGHYIFVGSSAQARNYIGPHTQTIDLAGKMAMPGINDAHLHPLEGAIKDLFECNFPFTSTPDEIAAKLADCVQRQPDALWIRGGQWGSDFFIDHSIESPRAFLDAVSKDKAIVLSDDALHNAWLNSKALELIGIDRNSPNPPGADILKDANGEPNGVLLEVFGYIRGVIPDWSDKQYLAAAKRVAQLANRHGITGVKDASSTQRANKSGQNTGSSR